MISFDEKQISWVVYTQTLLLPISDNTKKKELLRFKILPFNLFEFGDELPDFSFVIVTTVRNMFQRIGISFFQLCDTLFYRFLILGNRLIPNRWIAAAARPALQLIVTAYFPFSDWPI